MKCVSISRLARNWFYFSQTLKIINQLKFRLVKTFWLSGQVLEVSGSKAIIHVNIKFWLSGQVLEVSGSKAIVQVNLNFWLSGQVLEISGSKAIVQVNLKF
jgi:hypothetical protein